MTITRSKSSDTSHDQTGEIETPKSKEIQEISPTRSVKTKLKTPKQTSVQVHKGPKLLLPKEAWIRDQRVNVYCKPSNISTLMMKLTDRQKHLLGKSFISQFQTMPTEKFPTQLLLSLIRRRVKNVNQSVLSFNIEGNEVNFTLADFSLITGLNCGEIKFVNVEKLPLSTIQMEFFQNYSSPKLSTLKEKIDDYDFVDDNLSVKVAKIAILENIVVAKQQSNKLDSLYLRMVENQELFESYPWGRVAYDVLVQSIVNSFNSLQKSSFSISGFAYALIYWAFEIIPKLSEKERFATRKGQGIARMLNWDINKLAGDARRLEKDIFNDKVVIVHMEPTEEELAADFMALKEKMKDKKGKGIIKDHEHVEEDGEDDEDLDNYTDKFNETSMQFEIESDLLGETSKQDKTTLDDLKGIILGGFSILDKKFSSMFEEIKAYVNMPKESLGEDIPRDNTSDGVTRTTEQDTQDGNIMTGTVGGVVSNEPILDEGGTPEHTNPNNEDQITKNHDVGPTASTQLCDVQAIASHYTSLPIEDEANNTVMQLAPDAGNTVVQEAALPEESEESLILKTGRQRLPSTRLLEFVQAPSAKRGRRGRGRGQSTSKRGRKNVSKSTHDEGEDAPGVDQTIDGGDNGKD